MPTLDTTVLDKENMNVPVHYQKADSNQNAVQCADMLDCNGIALIKHTEYKLHKLFSPLISRSTNDYANVGNDLEIEDKILQNKKRSGDFEKGLILKKQKKSAKEAEKDLILKKQKKSAKEALTKHVKNAVSNNAMKEDGIVYDSCPEIVEKVSRTLCMWKV